MAGLIGAALGLAMLYFWLIGQWFARVVMSLFFAVSAILMAGGDAQYGWITLLVIGGGGWLIASAPTWFYRRKEARRDTSEPFVISYPR